MKASTLSAIISVAHVAVAGAATINVNPGESIQQAIDAASNGDSVVVAAGTYNEDINFTGKAISVIGSGTAATIIQGTGSGPVVTFNSGEGTDSVLDTVFVTGGSGVLGGGISIIGASPTIIRNIVANNASSSRGSGIYVENSTAEIYNNLVAYNFHTSGDPHGIEIVAASPLVINNTIVKTDSNGIIIRNGISAPLIMNNVIARNGSTVDGEKRGRGICDFSGSALIQYNDFFKNRKAAILAGSDFKRIRSAQRSIAPPRLLENVDGNPRYRRSKRKFEDATLPDDFFLRPGRGKAKDAGNPDPVFNDLDGTRNDIGFTGGPFARP